MIESLWETGAYLTRLNTLRTKATVGVHRALVKWTDGVERDSHLKIVFGSGGLPLRHHVNEAAGWLLARSIGLPVPRLAGFMMLNAKQIAAAHPERPTAGDTLAWVTSTEPDFSLDITDQMEGDEQLTRELSGWTHIARACAFDETIANADRYPRNLLRLGEKRFMLIDHDNLAGSAHWLADALLQGRFDDFANVLRDRCAPARGAVPCPERAFSNDMVGHAERHADALSQSAGDLSHWISCLIDDAGDAWALTLFLSIRARSAPVLVRKRYRLLT